MGITRISFLQVRAGAECFTIGTLLVTHMHIQIGQRTMKELALLDQGPL